MIKRIVSSVILVPIVVYLVMFSPVWLFNVFVVLISSVALFEWLSMEKDCPVSEKIFYMMLGVEFMVVALFFRWETFYFLMVLFIVHMIKGFSMENLRRDYYFFGGILYVALYAFFSYLRMLPHGSVTLMLVFVSLWVGDSFAYFCGKGFGKLKLSPRISPNKTVEGAICGVIFGTLAAGVFGCVLLRVHSLLWSVFIGFVSNVAGIFGDLSESVIKRVHSKKDSSGLIPGHGGVLDRLDSPAFAVFVIYLMFVWKIL